MFLFTVFSYTYESEQNLQKNIEAFNSLGHPKNSTYQIKTLLTTKLNEWFPYIFGGKRKNIRSHVSDRFKRK